MFKYDSKGLKMKEILDICLSEDVPEECVCQRVPTGITKSAVFVVNLEAVDDKDLTTDDCGIYGSHSSPSEEVDVVLDVHGKVSNFVTVRGTGADLEGSEYACVGITAGIVRPKITSDSSLRWYMVESCSDTLLYSAR